MVMSVRSRGWLFGILPIFLLLFVYFVANLRLALPSCSFACGIMIYSYSFVVVTHAITYVFKAYLGRSADRSKSCFFMPCAPQSILDEDKLQTLVAGSALFFAFDFFPVVIPKIKARYIGEESTQETERRMEELEVRQRLRSTLDREDTR
jgi:hypothetical protein